VGEKPGAEDPEHPLLFFIPFYGFPRLPDHSKTDRDHGNETVQCDQTAGFTLGDELIGVIPHVNSPGIALKAVSYTHLDVYKRQSDGKWKALRVLSKIQTRESTNARKLKQVPDNDCDKAC